MEWSTILRFPLPEIYQVTILTILDAALPLTVFAGYLLIRRKIFNWKRFMRGASVAVSLLAVYETSLMLLWTAFPGFNFGPVRLSGMLVVLTLVGLHGTEEQVYTKRGVSERYNSSHPVQSNNRRLFALENSLVLLVTKTAPRLTAVRAISRSTGPMIVAAGLQFDPNASRSRAPPHDGRSRRRPS